MSRTSPYLSSDKRTKRRRHTPRLRRRLGRTLTVARWGEYAKLLGIALGQQYRVLGVEQWLDGEPSAQSGEVLLIRHDVDQHPRSALRMAAIEQDLNVRSTWYFRWRTAAPEIVEAIRDRGHRIGMHYETLTRMVLERELAPSEADALVPEARELLATELETFARMFGPIGSACPHGDTRVPGVHNGVLLRGQDLTRFGIRWDSNAAVGSRGVDVWLTDRSVAEGRWQDGEDPIDLIVDRRSPLLIVVHPNNWVSGPALWWDRLVPGGSRTREDRPPLDRESDEDDKPSSTPTRELEPNHQLGIGAECSPASSETVPSSEVGS